MQLRKLYIKDFKILKDFTIDFPYDFKKYISVFIGANGSGKSTILEAIAQILSSAKLRQKSKFIFVCEYSIRMEAPDMEDFYCNVKLSSESVGGDILIEAIFDSGNLLYKGNIYNDNLKSSKLYMKYTYDLILSTLIDQITIVIYYSGLSEIMQKLVEPHNQMISTNYRKNNTLAERDFFYFESEHFGIILTSLLSFEYGDIPNFLFEKAKISEVQSIEIRLKKPDWANDTIQKFWGAKGVVRNFLDYLDENSTSLESLQKPNQSKGNGNIVIEAWHDEALIITIISQQKLFEIKNHLIEERELFEVLNIMHTDGMIDNISFSLKDEKGNGFGILSEGEQQTIIIKGLTEFLSEKNSLFLFDEPDTYLHPIWQRQFITEIEKTIDTSSNSENSYVIATHSPQLLSNAKAELNFVKIIEEGVVIEHTPKHYGREINTILYELMGVEERNKLVRTKISDLYTLIDEEEIKEAESSLKELHDLIGSDDPELKRAEIQITYLKEDE